MGWWNSTKNFLFGGDAAKGIDAKPQHYDAATAQLGQAAAAAANRAAPRIGGAQLAGGPQDQARAGMLGVANRLGAIASGQQAGAGELAVNRQVDAANAAQISAARMARGGNAALAARGAARNQADLALSGAAQASQAQMADQQQANALLGQTYGQLRSGDIDFASQNAQLGQQAQIENMRAQLAQTGMNDQQQIAALGQQLGWDQAKIQAELQRAGIRAGDKGVLPGLLQAGGQAAAMHAASDERLKTDVTDGGDDADEMMASLKPRSYRYQDEEKWGAGRRLGIMAQDLARSRMGRETIVRVDDRHMGFDLGKAASAALASVARLDERLRKIEGRD
jgi:hypothetical protein